MLKHLHSFLSCWQLHSPATGGQLAGGRSRRPPSERLRSCSASLPHAEEPNLNAELWWSFLAGPRLRVRRPGHGVYPQMDACLISLQAIPFTLDATLMNVGPCCYLSRYSKYMAGQTWSDI